MSFRRMLTFFLLLVLCPAVRAEDLERTRRILLPREEFLKLGAAYPDGVYLNGEDLRQLQAKIAAAQAARAADEPGQVPLALTSAAYQGELLPGVLRVHGVLELATDRKGWQELELPRLGTLLSARFDEGSGALSRRDGRLLLLAEGPGPRRLDLWFDVPLEAEAEVQRARLDLGSRGELRLTLPDSVAASLDGAVLERPDGSEPSLLVQLGGGERILELRARALGPASRLSEAGGRHTLHVEQGSLRGEHELTVQSWSQEPLRTLDILLPEGALLLSAGSGPELAKTEMRGRSLHVTLSRPGPTARIRLETLQPLVVGQALRLELLSVAGARWQTAVAEVLPDAEHELRVTALGGAQQLPSARHERGALRFFLPGPEAALSVTVEPEPRRTRATLAAVYRLAAEGVTLAGAVRLQATGVPPRSLELELDARDRLLQVQLDGAEVPWESQSAADVRRQRLRVVLPPQGSCLLRFRAERLLDRSALDAGPAPVELLAPQLPGLPESRVVLGLGVDPELHLSLRERPGFFLRSAEEAAELLQDAQQDTAAPEPVAYALLAAPDAGALVLELDRRLARIEAETTSFVHFTEAGLKVQAEVRYTIRDAPTDQLRLALPSGTGNRIRIEVEGLQERVLDSTPEADLFTLRLREKRIGEMRVTVAFDTPLETGLKQVLRIPEVGAAGVSRDEGTVLLEAADNLALRVLSVEGRELGLEDVPATAFYTPSDRLLAAYRTLARPYGLQVEVLRYEPLPLLGSVATEGTLRTVVLGDGRLQTEARYGLVNGAAQFLPVRLPPQTHLWSALLDGQPVKPFRRSDRILIALRPGNQEVRLLYETPASALGWFARLPVEPPDIGVPTLRLRWSLHPPEGYEAYVQGFGQETGTEGHGRRLPQLAEGLGELLTFLMVPQMFTMMLGAKMEPGYHDFAPASPAAISEGTVDFDDRMRQQKSLGYARDAKEATQSESDDDGAKKQKLAKDEEPAQAMEPGAPPPKPKIPALGKSNLGLGVLPLKLELKSDTPPLELSALTGEGGIHVTLARRSLLGRIQACVTLLVAAVCILRIGFPGPRHLFYYLAALLVLDSSTQLLGAWTTGFANAASDGILLGAGASLLLRVRRRWLASARGLALLALAASAPAHAESGLPAGPTTVFVPFHLEGSQVVEEPGAFLPGNTFQELFDRGHAPDAAPEIPPAAYALRSLRLEGALDGNGGSLTAKLEIDLPGEDWVQVPLGFTGPFDRALLDGAPAALVSDGGGLRLVARGRGSHVLELGLRVADADPGPGIVLRLALPEAAAGRLDLVIPAGFDAELSPARPFELSQESGQQRLLAALTGPELLVRASPAAEALEGRLQVENWLELRVFADRLQLGGHLVFADSRPLPAQLALQVPAALVLRSLRGPGLRGWDQQQAGRLMLRLEPGRRRVALELEGVLGSGPEGVLSALQPEAARGIAGAVVISFGADVLPELGEQRGVRRIAPEEALAAWSRGPGTPPSGEKLWAFAPENADFSLALHATVPRPAVVCRTSLLLRVDEPGAELVLALELEVRDAPLYELPLALPEGWRFEEARADQAVQWHSAQTDAKTRLRMAFPQGLMGRARLVSRWSRSFSGSEAMPALALPAPELGSGVLLAGGELGLSAAPGLELVLEPAPGARLSPLGPDELQVRLDPWPIGQAYRFREPPAGLVRLRAQKARVSVSVVEHVFVGESHLEGQALLFYEAGVPGIDVLRFRVPEAVAKTLEIDAPRVRNVVKLAGGGTVGVTVELQSPASGTVPVEVRWSAPLVLGSEAQLPRIQPEDPAPAEAYVLVETDPVLLVSDPARQDAELVADPEQLPSLPSQLQMDRIRWMYRYRGPQSAVRVKAERLRTEGVLQAIVDLADLQSVVDAEGRCRTRARFELQNRTEQFLDVTLPRGTELWSAAVAGQPVKPARSPSGAEGEIRVPLPKQSDADLSFATELWYVSRVPLQGLRGSFELASPRVTNLPVKKTLWTLWLPHELGLSFGGTLEEASEGELTAEKALEILDLQSRLVGTLESSAGRKREKLVQNLQSLQQRYSELDQTAQQQLRSYRRGGGSEADEERRNRVSLDQLERGRALFDENLRKVERAPAQEDAQQVYSQSAAQSAHLQQALTANWALTNKGLAQMALNEEADRAGLAAQARVSGATDLEQLFFTEDGSRLKTQTEHPAASLGDFLESGERQGEKERNAPQSVEEIEDASEVGADQAVAAPEMPASVVPQASGPMDDERRDGLLPEPPPSEPQPVLAPDSGLAPPPESRPVPPVESRPSVRREGVLGLSLEFPAEGQSYHFKGLQGEGSIRVVFTSGRLWSRLQVLAWLLAALGVLYGLSRLAGRMAGIATRLGRALRRRAGAVSLGSLALFVLSTSLIFLVLSVAAGILFISRRFA